ncbi:unnamed protein product, partial [Durusdinium trenchii]
RGERLVFLHVRLCWMLLLSPCSCTESGWASKYLLRTLQRSHPELHGDLQLDPLCAEGYHGDTAGGTPSGEIDQGWRPVPLDRPGRRPVKISRVRRRRRRRGVRRRSPSLQIA